MSFFHTVFAREHNLFVDAFRAQAATTPDADSGLRHPDRPTQVIRYRDVSADDLFEIARLVVSAEIAKIRTTEWTPQLLYDEPLYLGMNANWSGLFRGRELVEQALERITTRLGTSKDETAATVVLGLRVRAWNLRPGQYSDVRRGALGLANPEHVNGGVNHFGSPFNFPEEFVTVYRLHPMVPDLIEYRQWDADPNLVQGKVPVVETFRGRHPGDARGRARLELGSRWAGRRLGALTLHKRTTRSSSRTSSCPAQSETGRIDVAALDLIKDRERGVPRFNEFRRQYGLRQLTRFDDFVDTRLAKARRAGRAGAPGGPPASNLRAAPVRRPRSSPTPR